MPTETRYEVVYSFRDRKHIILPYAVFERPWTKFCGTLEECQRYLASMEQAQ